MRRLRGGWLAALLAVVSACSADGMPDRAAPADTLPAKPELAVASRAVLPPPDAPDSFTVLVTSDEGVDAAGLDAAVSALLGRPGLEIVVVAPARSGRTLTGSTSVPALEAAATLSGFPAESVDGTPVDAVVAALTQGAAVPDLVVVGLRSGQTLGRDVDRSGGVAAAQAAAALGVPALVVNAEVVPQVDLAAAALQLTDLFDHELELLIDRPATTWNLNVPTCTRGMLRGRVLVGAARVGHDGALVRSDCTAPATTPHRTDVEAFAQGFATLVEVRS